MGDLKTLWYVKKKSAKKDHTLYVLYISIKINTATEVV